MIKYKYLKELDKGLNIIIFITKWTILFFFIKILIMYGNSKI